MKKPWRLPLGEALKIAVPKGGAGALIYYQGLSEPETADFIRRFLKPGMVFLDVGAHIGEYSLLGSLAVTTKGEVHAFEPNPEVFWLLEENVRMNNLDNVFLSNCAVCDLDGETEFEIYAEPSVSSLCPRNAADSSYKCKPLKSMAVPCMRLDTYWSEAEKRLDLVKVDVEGAEMLVFLGAEKLLQLSVKTAPVWIFEYSRRNYAYFGCRIGELFGLLEQHGYAVWRYCGEGRLIRFSPAFVPSGTVNLVAAKNERNLRSTLGTG